MNSVSCAGVCNTGCGARKCPSTEYLDSSGLCFTCCPWYKAHQLRLLGLCEHPGTYERKFEQEVALWVKHSEDHHGLPPRADKSHQGNGTYKGSFAFTLTKSPDDLLTEEDMINAARKIMSQKSCPVKKYAWFLEYSDNETKTHPHIHGMYETETQGRIEKKHWKRSWEIWGEGKGKMGAGFRGGYHRPVRSEECYANYIKKDKGLNEYYLE